MEEDQSCEPPAALEQFDLSRWMEKLPHALHHAPLNMLAIPGSHNSFTFYLNQSGSVSPDEPTWMQTLGQIFGKCAKRIIYNWASVQSLSVTEQLYSGIRYFDIRVGTKSNHSELYCVHGLYGHCIDEYLADIESFLNTNEKEIVLLDFNHFYNVNHEAHHCFIRKLIKRFGAKLCPASSNLHHVSLKFMWNMGYQLIVMYQHCIAHEFPKQLWPGCCVIAPWPNTAEVPKLLEALERNYEQGRPATCFYVTQGILTPDTKYIFSHLGTSLKESLALCVATPFLDWVRGKTVGRNGINICILDCVELSGFTETIIGLNYGCQSSLTQ